MTLCLRCSKPELLVGRVHIAFALLVYMHIVAVAVPSVAQEAARDLVRAREDVRGDLMSAHHRVSKLLLRQGIV